MRTTFKLFTILIIAALLLLASFFIYLKHAQSPIDGILIADPIEQTVTVTRDQWGIPHIKAKNALDAYFTLGFVLGQDRLFQMDLQRRASLGELSELFGSKAVEVDKLFRTLRIKSKAEELLVDESSIEPEALEYLDAFLSGVNYFIESQPIPLEYRLLGTKPRKFTRLDSVASMGYVAYSFADGIKRDSLYSEFQDKLSDNELALLFPEYLVVNPVTIMEPRSAKKLGDSVSQSEDSSAPVVAISQFHQSLVSITSALHEWIPAISGSNSWVLAPSRSKSGKALLANDPHVGISNPGTWYEAHIAYPGYENYGYYLPTMPFPLLGHNQLRAWALTMFENDDMDLYRETFHPDDDLKVMHHGKWVDVQIIKEIIQVKGEASKTLSVRVTPRGPIISDFISNYEGPPISLAWVYLKVNNPILNVLYGMNYAQSMEEFRQSISSLAAPGLNISYVDHEGNIAWWAAGSLPIRPKHVTGKQVNDGSTGEDAWLGYLPFHSNPHMVNPPSGVIVTANNLPTRNEIDSLGRLTGYFRPSDRAERIHSLLDTRHKWSLEELKSVQTDMAVTAASQMAKRIYQATSRQPKWSSLEEGALTSLKEWDGSYTLSSVGSTVFEFTTYHLVRNLLVSKVGEEGAKHYLNLIDHWSFLKGFLLYEQAAPFDDKSKSTLMVAAFKQAVKDIESRFGNEIDGWQWRYVHRVEYVHPLGKVRPLNLLFNVGPFAAPSGFPSINKLKSKKGEHDFRVASLPSTRRLISLDQEEGAWSILPTGNSGNVLSEHYADQAELYLSNGYRMINYTPQQVKEQAAGVLELRPR